MAKGRDRTHGMILAGALLLALSVWMAPAAEALPNLTAPWTPLSVPDSGPTLTAPWTPLSVPDSNPAVYTAPWTPLADSNVNDNPGYHTAPWTPLSVPDGTDGAAAPGTAGSLTAADVAAAIVVPGPLTAPATPLSAPVPEPATVTLLGIGILALMIIAWRRADILRR